MPAPTGGLEGTLRLVDSEDSYFALTANPPQEQLAILLHHALFNKSSVVSLQEAGISIAGLLVFAPEKYYPAGTPNCIFFVAECGLHFSPL